MKEFDFNTKNLAKFFIVTDIHGKYEELSHLLSMRDEDETFICLGDIGDRGDKSFECFELISKIKNRILLYGNHDLAIKWAIKYKNRYAEDIWLGNGGLSFISSLPSMKNKNDINIYDFPEVIMNTLEEMVLYHRSGNLLFVHGGINIKEFSTLPNYFEQFEDEETGINYVKYNIYNHPIWVRDYFLSRNKPVYDTDKNRILIIHGHTKEKECPRISDFDVNLDTPFNEKLCAMRIHGNKYEFLTI